MLRTLLDHGMNPDTCNWQGQTMLHMLCRPDPQGKDQEHNTLRAGMLLDAGATYFREKRIQSSATPAGLAARNNNHRYGSVPAFARRTDKSSGRQAMGHASGLGDEARSHGDPAQIFVRPERRPEETILILRIIPQVRRSLLRRVPPCDRRGFRRCACLPALRPHE